MKLKLLFCLLMTFLLITGSAQAQQPKKVPRIGYLSASDAATESTRAEATRLALRALGYIEGQNIAIEYRYAERKVDQAPELLAELVGLKVDLIVVSGGPTWIRAAKNATKTIPIVTTGVGIDAVVAGLVESLARPGGNITGLSILAPELSGKRLELLKEIIPKLSRLAVFGTSTSPDNAQSLKEVQLAAGALKVNPQYLDIRDPKDFETAFQAATKGRAQGVLMMVLGTFVGSRQKETVDLAVKHRLPVMYTGQASVEAGGLISYGVNNSDLDRRVATYVDKILKGAKPAELPVEQPTKFEFVVNLKTAKQIGITIPPNVLARADRVIR